MHTHIGAIAFVTSGVYIMLWLTLWRLLGMHAIASSSNTLNHLGQAMLVQG
jgi:hypothetical protein